MVSVHAAESVSDWATSIISRAHPLKQIGSVILKALSPADVALGLALVAWAISLTYVQGFNRTYQGTDAIILYFPTAQKVLDGQGYQAFAADVYRGPGYPLMLAAIARLLQGDLFAASKVIAVAFSVLFLFFAYLLLRRVFDPTTALAAVLLTMAVNMFAFVSCAAGTDVPFAALAMASVFFIVRRERPSRSDAVLSGILGGLALTVRWTGLFLPFVILAGVALIPARGFDLRSRISLTGWYVAAFLITSSPWLVVNYLLHGTPLHNESMQPALLDLNLFPPSVSGLGAMLQVILQEPVGFGLKFVGKFIGSFPAVVNGFNRWPWPQGWVMAGPFWILILLGAALLLTRINRAKVWLLLISIYWWASLMPVHFEARFYILLLPTFAALAVFVITSGALPDIRFSAGESWRIARERGFVLDSIIGHRPSRKSAGKKSGVSLTSMVLFGLLAFSAFAEVGFVRSNYQGASGPKEFYHEVAQLVRQLQRSRTPRPVGTRQWSLARYWIPWEAHVPVAPFPLNRDYKSILSSLSFVLYDQIDDKDSLIDGWEAPTLSELSDPLRAPANLEVVYYKPTSPRSILYRVLESSSPAPLAAAHASSALSGNAAAQAIDQDAESWWSSAPHANDDAVESITLDLGRPTAINRVWLLPRQDGQTFPASLQIDVSTDGAKWRLIGSHKVQQPLQQNPWILPFSAVTARFVKITVNQLRWDGAQKAYLVSLAEARASLAVERPSEMPAFSLSPAGMSYDPLGEALAAEFHNQGDAPGTVTVEFSKGWAKQTAQSLAVVESSIAQSGGVGIARMSLGQPDIRQPGYCLPVWAIAGIPADMGLDTYGTVRRQPQIAFSLVCSPQVAVIDDFAYSGSPLEHGWIGAGETTTGSVSVVADQDVGSHVMQVTKTSGDSFAVGRQVRVRFRQHLSLQMKAIGEFIVYVGVRDEEGYSYHLQYIPTPWRSWPGEFPQGKYISYAVGAQFADGRWHKLMRDVYRDFSARTGKQASYIESLAVRTSGSLSLAGPELSARQ